MTYILAVDVTFEADQDLYVGGDARKSLQLRYVREAVITSPDGKPPVRFKN
jgi:hypothetical protein